MSPFSVIVLAAAMSCVCISAEPTLPALLQRHELDEQPLNAFLWRAVAGKQMSVVARVRLPMVADVLRELRAARPDKQAVLALLGPDEYEGAFGEAVVYALDHPDECWADLYWLVISFEHDGAFKGAFTSCD